MNKTLAFVAGIMSAALMLAVPVAIAAEKGQIEGGDIYWAKNVTKGGDFVDPANATCGDTVQFRVRLHNPGPSPVTNVNVKATLPSAAATSHSSTVTISSASAQPSVTTDTAGVQLDKPGTLSYVPGTTELLDANGSKMSTFADTILTTGVNVETVGVSTQQKRFVQFQAKVDCKTTEQPGKITVCELETGNIVTIDEDAYDDSKHTTDLSQCEEDAVVTELPQTGSTGILAGLGLSALVAGGAYALQRRNILG